MYLLFWQFVSPLDPFWQYIYDFYLSVILLLASYEFPSGGRHSGTAWQTPRPCDHVISFWTGCKNCWWMKMEEYIPSLNILNWVLAPPFHFQRLDYMWVTNPRSVCKKHFHHFGGVAWFCQDFGSVTSTTYRDSTLKLEESSLNLDEWCGRNHQI